MSSSIPGLALTLALSGNLRSDAEHDFIVGGEPAPDPEYGAIGRLVSFKECSLVFVSPKIALTAAHCIDDIPFGTPVYAMYGDVYDVAHRIQVLDKGFHPAYCPSCRHDGYDYAYVVLDRELPPEVPVLAPIASPETWDTLMVEGTELEAVGFGCTTPDGGGRETRSKITTTVNRFSRNGTEFLTSDVSCKGDSGGAAVFRAKDGQAWLGGILSRSGGSDRATVFGAPYPALCWLRDETGLDFVGESCSACDCIDLPVSETSSGCQSSIAGEPARAVPLIALLLLVGRRRSTRCVELTMIGSAKRVQNWTE